MIPTLNKLRHSNKTTLLPVCHSERSPVGRMVTSAANEPRPSGSGYQNALTIAISIFLLIISPSCKKQSEPSDPPNIFSTPKNTSLPTETIHLLGQPFIVELAYQRPSRQQGLMFRKELPPNAGMLFIFDNIQTRSFYMKNCLIDLDLIWITEDRRIAQITTMTVPISGKPLIYYHSPVPIKYALELPAKTCQTLGLKTGQTIPFPPRIQRITPDPD